MLHTGNAFAAISSRTKLSIVWYICHVGILKTILLTIVCMQMLLPAKFLKDMARLPVLVAHYFQHSHTGKHIHFIDFIADHYSDPDHSNNDHSNHENLPFHNHDLDFHQNIFTVAMLDIFPPVSSNFDVADTKTKIISRQHFHSSTALSSIWRPPKPA